MKEMSRRSFMQTGVITGSALTANGLSASQLSAAEDKQVIRHRELGSTGWKVSEIGFGAMNTRDPELLQAAIDSGINYIDTANSYMRGENEAVIGKVMQKSRDKVFLTTKLKSQSHPETLSAMMEESRQRLDVDQVDALLAHNISDLKQITSTMLMDTFASFRDKGLTRFVGISTHELPDEYVDAIIDSKLWQLLLISYNYTSAPEIAENIKRVREAGIAVVAMKTQMSGRGYADGSSETVTPNQAALKWVLNNKYVDTTIPGMATFEHLAENMAVMGMKLTKQDSKELLRFGESLKGNYCTGVVGCTGCRDKCPKGVAIHDINRCLGYVNGYGDMRLARENYDRLPASSRVDACSDCTECTVKCINGLNLTKQIRQARSLFC